MTVLAFDFDGTLTESEMTVVLGERAGVADEMARITEQAMNDDIDYAESLRQRVQLLAGLSGEEVAAAFDEIELRPGAAELLTTLGRNPDVTTAIFTGGFERGVRRTLDRAGTEVDVIVANQLGVSEKTLTGEVDGPLVEGTKDVTLRALVEELDETLADVIAVGDGANDLPMLGAAGYAVGFDPKPAVAPHCDRTVASIEELEGLLRERQILA